MLTVTEVEQFLAGYQVWGWSEWMWSDPVETEIGRIEVVDTEGGGEGEGEHVHVVFKLSRADSPDRYFTKYGKYYSFDGTEWSYSPFEEVEPREKLITVYDKKV